MPYTPRVDSWEALLTEEQWWQIYERSKQYRWYEVTQWIEDEMGVPAPKQSAYYRFLAAIREHESERRIQTALSVKEDVRRAMDQVGNIDSELTYAWTQMAMESALKGDTDAGNKYLQMALSLRDRQIQTERNELKRADLALVEQRMRDQAKSAIDRGLDAIAQEAEQNPEALQLLQRFRGMVMGDIDAAA